MNNNGKPLTYRDAGVDIDAGDRAVGLIRDLARSTFTRGVVTDIGGFGGLFSLAGMVGDDPVLVSGTDGVGTKLKIAFMTGRHDTVGIDAVAMCVNDVICSGAKPLFFLDYLAVGRLEPESVRRIIAGIAEGCGRAGCALIGGEMAEMPGFYADGEYDIAGFCVGLVERPLIVDGTKIEAGDAIIGLPASGLHSNGFSLVRKVVFERAGLGAGDIIAELGGRTVGEELLEPTAIYTAPVAALVSRGLARGIAHITGGGLEGNLSRVLPEGRRLNIDWASWRRPAVFDWLKSLGSIAEEEMRRVFNCGIGMAVIVAKGGEEEALGAAAEAGCPGVRIGVIE